MKRLTACIAMIFTLLVLSIAPAAQARGSVSISIGGFYDELSPYGRWVDCSYGECWVPADVESGWQPYTNGEWVWTRYGWTWVSHDRWGGNPYHYGSWTNIDNYGWAWVPGTVWAPAWVTWSYSDNYVGWAPVPPTFAVGYGGYSGGPVVVNTTHYVYVPTNRFVGGNVMQSRVPVAQNTTIFPQTRRVTNFSVSGGVIRNAAIPMAQIQRATGTRIAERPLTAANTTPQSIRAGARAGGGRLTVAAPAATVKAAVAARPAARGGAEKEANRPAPQGRREATPQAQRRQATPPSKREATPQAQRRQATPPPKREATPQAQRRQATPPPKREATPQAERRQATPPPKREATPPAEQRKVASPPQRQAAPSAVRSERGGPPPKAEAHGKPPEKEKDKNK
jgi:hypothetical protein